MNNRPGAPKAGGTTYQRVPVWPPKSAARNVYVNHKYRHHPQCFQYEPNRRPALMNVASRSRVIPYRTQVNVSESTQHKHQRGQFQPQRSQQTPQCKEGKKRRLFWGGVETVNKAIEMLDDPNYQDINKVAEDELKKENEAAGDWLKSTPFDRQLHQAGEWLKTGIKILKDAHSQVDGDRNSLLHARWTAQRERERRPRIRARKSAILARYPERYPNIIKMRRLKAENKKQRSNNEHSVTDYDSSRKDGLGDGYASEATLDSEGETEYEESISHYESGHYQASLYSHDAYERNQDEYDNYYSNGYENGSERRETYGHHWHQPEDDRLSHNERMV